MATYDKKPLTYEANGNGSFTYRFDIKEVQMENDMDSKRNEQGVIKWECKEVVVWATVTANKITEAVIGFMWSNSYEQKMFNDYYAAKEGLFGDTASAEAKKYIARYKSFLVKRKAIKDQVDVDCMALNIV